MDGRRFDTVAKAVAGGATRRQALRRLGGGLVGGALAALGLGPAAAQETCPRCRQCIAQFQGSCVSVCVRMVGDESRCALACCEGNRTTCAILGECTAACTARCPVEAA